MKSLMNSILCLKKKKKTKQNLILAIKFVAIKRFPCKYYNYVIIIF